MVLEQVEDQNALVQVVNNSLKKAQKQVSGLRKTNTRLLITNIVFSAATTVVAGGTAATGPLIGEGPAGWRISCIIAAIFAFIAAVTTAITQQLSISERLLQGHQCVSRLRDLDLSITTGSSTWEEISKEFRDIVRTFPEHIG